LVNATFYQCLENRIEKHLRTTKCNFFQKNIILRMSSFKELGLCDELVQACQELNYTKPTPIQEKSIPVALEKRDIIGLAQTGSGKTAAFALPILNSLWNDPSPFYCAVLAPTRELAVQIGEQFEALGSKIGVKVAVIVGGI
jgi:ATP-dependent RNA helicase DDX47/RRP3